MYGIVHTESMGLNAWFVHYLNTVIMPQIWPTPSFVEAISAG